MKYRKKPVVIDAVKWNGKNVLEIYNFLEGTTLESQAYVKSMGENFYIKFCNGGCSQGDLIIKTLEGDMKSSIGDYIIKGVKGEYYACKPDVFNMTYEAVE